MSLSLCGANSSININDIDCDGQRQLPRLLAISAGSYDSNDYADSDTFLAALIADTKLARTDSNKLIVLPVIQGTTDQTVAPKDGNLGYGLVFRLVDGRATYTFDIPMGSTSEKALKSLDGKTAGIFIYDSGQQFWGIADVAGNFSAPKWNIAVTPRPFQDGQNVKVTQITISLVNTDDFIINAYYVPVALNTASLKGLNDAQIIKISNTTNVYQYRVITPTTAIGRPIDLGLKFGSTLAVVSLWLAKTGPGFGTTLTIMSVAYSNGIYTVTYDSTAYTALSTGAKIKQALADPTALDTANVTGIEGIPVIVTK